MDAGSCVVGLFGGRAERVGQRLLQQQLGDTLQRLHRIFVREEVRARWTLRYSVRAGYDVPSMVAAQGSDERGSDVVQEQILDVTVLLDGPLVRLEQHGVGQRVPVCGERADDVGHARDSRARRVVDVLEEVAGVSTRRGARGAGTDVVAVRVDGLCVEAVLALAVALLDVLADPYIPVEPENEVNAARERGEMRFESAYERRRHNDELAIPQLIQNQVGKQAFLFHAR